MKGLEKAFKKAMEHKSSKDDFNQELLYYLFMLESKTRKEINKILLKTQK